MSLWRLSMRMKSFPMPWYLLNGTCGSATAAGRGEVCVRIVRVCEREGVGICVGIYVCACVRAGHVCGGVVRESCVYHHDICDNSDACFPALPDVT